MGRPLESSRKPDPGFYAALGRAIRVLRTERDLERKHLAERSGVSYPYLSEIENGKKQPSSEALLAIADALGVRPYELLASAEAWLPPGRNRARRAAKTADPLAPGQATAPRSWFGSPGDALAMSASAPAPEPAPPSLLDELIARAQRLPPEDLERLVDLAERMSRSADS